MSTEKHHEMTDWRSRVGDIEGLTGEPAFNSARSWDKLQSRLDKKKHRIAPYWYWAAAAFLVIMLNIPMLKMNNRKSDVTVQEKMLPGNKPANTIEKKINPPAEPHSPVVAKQHIHQHRQNKKFVHVAPPVVIKTPVQEIIIQDPPADTASVQVRLITESPVKKIKVVHINEIAAINEIAENNNRSDFASMNIVTTIFRKSYVINQSSDNIIKIKLPSN
jgi:hypothetical protein